MALPEDATEIDELFPDEEELDADDILAASTAAIEDIDAGEDIEIAPADLPPVGRNWAFDFVEGRFVSEGKSPKTIRGDAAIEAWVEKCLRTQQGSSVVQPPEYGLAQSLTDYLGLDADEDDFAALETDIQEALTLHPQIEAVENFEVQVGESVEGDLAVAISFRVVLGDDTDIPFEAELEVEAAV